MSLGTKDVSLRSKDVSLRSKDVERQVRTTFHLLVYIFQGNISSIYNLETEEEQLEAYALLCEHYDLDPEVGHDSGAMENEVVMVDTMGFFKPAEVLAEHEEVTPGETFIRALPAGRTGDE